MRAGVVKLVDALDSKSSGTCFRVGSIPTSGTNLPTLLMGKETRLGSWKTVAND